MRVPRWFGWLLIGLTVFTAGLLRQFHDRTPSSPHVPAVVGSLLFAAVVFLLLVSARERRKGPLRGAGVRLGSITPLLLMLLVEKWASLTLYGPVFGLWSRAAEAEVVLDAKFRAAAGGGLLLVCLLIAGFSRPAARRTWFRLRARRLIPAVGATVLAVVGCYVGLWGLGALLGASMSVKWPAVDPLWAWVFGGQALRAGAEEIYYRGLLLFEIQRLAPRLGVRSPSGRRWTALLLTSGLFAFEHVAVAAPLPEMARRLVFTWSLGLLLGIVVLVSSNLYFAAGLHAWINWLLLGIVPRFVNELGEPMLSPGTYIGMSMTLAFILLFEALRRWRGTRGHARAAPGSP